MDDLTEYIITYYSHLMTVKEAAAHKTNFWEKKARSVENTIQAQMIRKRWVSDDPEILALLAKGEDQFYGDVCIRILRDQSDEIFFNHCPKCNALARTPKAKQCPKCFHSWHDNE